MPDSRVVPGARGGNSPGKSVVPVVAVIAALMMPLPLTAVIAVIAAFIACSVPGVITGAVDDGLQDVAVCLNRSGNHTEGEKK